MSGFLWKYYLEDDVDGFRQLLEGATYSARPGAQRITTGAQNNPGAFIGSPGSLGTSPTVLPRPRFGGTPRSAVTLTRADINFKDANGLTILHHAATSTSETAFAFATALLEHPLTDLYAQDLENGWTALHRAFYFGNVSIARSIIDRDVQDALGHGVGGVVQGAGGLIKIKDKEGNGPLDVFATTIKDRTLRPEGNEKSADEAEAEDDFDYDDPGDGEERHTRRKLSPITDIKGDELFTFGSNRNVTLGFGDEDDRQYPERVILRRPDHLLRRFYREHLEQKHHAWMAIDASLGDFSQIASSQSVEVSALPTFIRSTPLIIQDVQMSKLHTAVLTTDPESNLYMCGHGPGGRLGLGHERTNFQFACLEGGALTGKKVLTVALGQNHSLALSDEGEIFSWGNNGFGQLGYSLPKTGSNDEDPIQTLPRQIFGPLKREVVVGIAASRIHSVAHTATALYTFGKNEGQLGIVDSDARSLEMQITPRNVAASLFSSPIASVNAIDRATVCLLENHEVWVFANYGYAKLSFPLDGFTNYFLKSSFLTTKYDTTPNRICKITSGGDTICAMSSAGEVFTVAVSKRTESGQDKTTSTTNPSKIRGALSQPYRIWSLKKGYMAARDVDVDQDGSIILTTEAGSVWRRVKRTKIKDASAAGTGDYKPKDYKFSRVPGLTRVTAVRASAFGAYAAVRKDCDVTKSQIVVDSPMLWDDVYPLLPLKGWAQYGEDSEDEEPLPAFWTKPTEIQRITKRALESKDFEQELTSMLRTYVDDSDSTYDMVIGSTVSDVRVPVHQWLFAGRSKIMRQGLAELRQHGSFSVSEALSLEQDDRGQTVVMLQGMDVLTLFDLVLYIYTDNVVDFWHYTRQYPQLAFRYRQIRTELMKISSRLELKQLEPAVRQMVRPRRCLTTDMELAIKDSTFFDDADIILELADGELPVHSSLMVQRCPFFEGMFKGRAAGLWLAGRRTESEDTIRIDLKHIQVDIFKLVLRHLYADSGDEIFDDFVSDNLGDFLALSDFLDHILDVMSVANELMLDRLSQVCQQVIGRYVNVRNVCQMLNAISACSVTEFKDAALEYICLSLEAVLQNGILDELDEDLLFELDQVVRENQLACLPFARSGRSEALLLEKYPELAERIDRGRQAKIDSIVLQGKYADADARMSTSLRAGSFDERSPMQQKARRSGKDVKAGAASPSLTPLKGKQSAADLMFDMDEDGDDTGIDDIDLELDEPQSGGPVKAFSLNPKSPASPWQDNKTASLEPTFISPSSATPNTLEASSLAAKAAPINRTADKPWGAAPLQSTKLDMKDIMAQAQTSSDKPSAISLALSAEAKKEEKASGSSSITKLSQKERKKLQQAQQEAQAQAQARAVASLANESKPASPWQTRSPSAQVALKDILTSPPALSPSPASRTTSAPALTMRQTIANNGPTAKQKATIPASPAQSTPAINAAQASPSASTASAVPARKLSGRPAPSPQQANESSATTPRPASGKGFAISQSTAAATPQSIRHIQQEQRAEASLQLSMADILSQQQAEKDVIKEAAAKRSLQEIQQEQEFQEWWDKESRRVMEEEARASQKAQKGSGRGKGAGKSAKGGAGGGAAAAGGAGKGAKKSAAGAAAAPNAAGAGAESAGRQKQEGEKGGRDKDKDGRPANAKPKSKPHGKTPKPQQQRDGKKSATLKENAAPAAPAAAGVENTAPVPPPASGSAPTAPRGGGGGGGGRHHHRPRGGKQDFVGRQQQHQQQQHRASADATRA
ncbi:uncharacterized protein K452DRAFT_289930 [Aplosporella prunicola CBS 121167]|uniref:BTB domain-containing protein n=1 Tax=Aplosporella prunicola CBS 121167 TaxID=1176127 RepID=A0A6A6B5T5_9PEZI|nr:uncharacterized protein K452DRAFT_289930 [Aplosporella prunicola CBS 121167]KAF2139380.1 hypothetical protein K452DRAFT_289930 [Aplosporella prunicola CBS 121167]